jgi:carboxymethylenebutenolidase
MNEFQEYFIHEFVEDYKEGSMSRRDMMRRVLYLTGGVASTAALLSSMGVPTLAMAAPIETSVAASLPLGASPLSVAPDDPAITTQWVSFPNANDGATILAYEARPTNASGPLPVVLLCHRNAGVEPHIQDVARRWAKLGYLTAAVDLLSRNGGTEAIQDKAQIPSLLSSADPDRNVSDFAAAADYYVSNPNADANRMGMNGYCFGGSLTWRTVEAVPALKAGVPFYGGVPPLDQVPNINAAMLGVYSADPNDNANRGRDDLEAALSAAGIVHQLMVFPDTRHDFYNDTNQSYNEPQALAAWNNATAWMDQYVMNA